jgi:PAS domain S-box-containing protein
MGLIGRLMSFSSKEGGLPTSDLAPGSPGDSPCSEADKPRADGFEDLSIRRKVTGVIMLTSATVLILTAAAFIGYDFVTYRQLMARNLTTTARTIAGQSSAPLAANDKDEATRVLGSLQLDPNVKAGAILDSRGNMFAQYPAHRAVSLPSPVEERGHHFKHGRLLLFEPVVRENSRLGTLYLETEARPLFERLRLYGGIALLVLLGSALAAWVLSHALEKRITQPIIALANTAAIVSEQRDFSVRAPKLGTNELGTLTDAFNQMLGRIQEAEEARSFLAAIVESADAAIIGKDLQGTIISWNKGAEALFGYTASAILGQPITRIVSPDRPEEEPRLVQEILRGAICSYDTVRIRDDGTPVEVLLIASPVKDRHGRIIGISSIARDITERKRAERELRESRARLSSIIDSAMDAIISVDEEQRVQVFNAAAERMFQCSANEALGQSLDRFIPTRFQQSHREHMQKFAATGESSRAMGHPRPLSGLRADGQEFPIEASISQTKINGKKLFTVIVRDITKRQRAQETLERHAAKLREQSQLLDLANVLARDLQDRIILWNSGMEKMYGWTREEALGKTTHEFLHTESSQTLESIREVMLHQGRWEGELVHTRKDGGRIWVASIWVLHRNEQGEPLAVLEVNNDISGRKMAEEEVRRMNLELEQRVEARTAELTAANREMEAFIYSVAHDLRAPLRHIDAFGKILVEDYAEALPVEAQRYVESIRNGSQHMSHLVDDLLNLARVGRQELMLCSTSLDELVTEARSSLTREVEGRHIDWRIQPLPSVECDPGLMRQVLVNLISNAMKYTRPRPVAVIEIGSLEMNGTTVVFVRDNGVGFNMKYSDKLFGVFQRLHRSDDFEGTGVGLATVDRILRKHGSCIWAEAAVDKGAAFYFTVAKTN